MEAGDLEMGFRPPPGEVFWRVLYQPPGGEGDELEIFVDIETGDILEPIIIANEPEPVPVAYALLPNFPNPFNPETTITFDVARRGAVTLTVYDVLGRTIRQLVDTELGQGRHEVRWDGTAANGVGVASGIYLYRLEAEGFVASRLMTFLK
jgi:hypothetical protein